VTYLQFKFRPDASNEARKRLLNTLEAAQEVSDVGPLLPGESDEELAAMFVVSVPKGAQAKQVERILSSNASVEYVEGPLKRKAL
jgi:hypothetical protein